jgi:ABC-type transporter Mla subunit MlaD
MSASSEKTEEAFAGFSALVQQALATNQPNLISDADLSRVLRDALRLYAFKSDKAGQYLPPYESGAVTATETVVAATGIIRAADLNLWDLAMWFNRVGSAPTDSRGGREG